MMIDSLEAIDLAEYVEEVCSAALPGKTRHPLVVEARRLKKKWQKAAKNQSRFSLLTACENLIKDAEVRPGAYLYADLGPIRRAIAAAKGES